MSDYQGRSLKSLRILDALEQVPPEYQLAWEWFDDHAGRRIERLPYGKGRPAGMPMPLARQAAIYCPSYHSLPSKGAGKKRYALSVYSVGQSVYADGNRSDALDGTWSLNYHEQRGKDPNQDYNELLFNCMNDGIPIGVMVRSAKGGYDVLGLAAIESYDRLAHTFLLHGPVRMHDAGSQLLPEQALAAGSLPNKAPMGNLAEGEQIMQPPREDYGRFRGMVFDAYEGACAITEVDIPELLDAALITGYRNRQSLVLRNGILLRTDVCRLYDTNLLSITPDSHVVATSRRLAGSGYARLSGCEVRLPREAEFAPDDELLDERYRLYCSLEKDSA